MHVKSTFHLPNFTTTTTITTTTRNYYSANIQVQVCSVFNCRMQTYSSHPCNICTISNQKTIQTLPDLCSIYAKEGPEQVDFCAQCAYTQANAVETQTPTHWVLTRRIMTPPPPSPPVLSPSSVPQPLSSDFDLFPAWKNSERVSLFDIPPTPPFILQSLILREFDTACVW